MVMALFDCSSPHDVTISAASQSQERGRYPLQHYNSERKRAAKRALLTNVYVYRKGRTEAKAKANHTYRLTEIRRHAKAEPEIPWSKLMDNCHGGSCDLKLAKMYVIEKCCNGYRPRSCNCDAALIVTLCGDEQSNNAITITTTLKSV